MLLYGLIFLFVGPTYGKVCISSHYYCYLSYNSFHMGIHTDLCQFTPLFNDLLVMKNSHCQ